ncbi:MAG: hypothetical protein ACLRP8_10170 [Roseburia intestinalis]
MWGFRRCGLLERAGLFPDKKRNGVPGTKEHDTCAAIRKAKRQCMKNIFCMIFIIGINTVEDGGRAVFFYAHFMDSPVSAKDKAVGVGDVKDGKFGGIVEQRSVPSARDETVWLL